MRKEVAVVRKKIDSVNKELKPLGHTCQKKVKFSGIFLCLQWTIHVYWFFFSLGQLWHPMKTYDNVCHRKENTRKPLKPLMKRTRRKYS